jgi:hypothetical protein
VIEADSRVTEVGPKAGRLSKSRRAASAEFLYIPRMQLTKPHLIADVQMNDVANSLSGWSWLLGGAWSPLLVSAVGDVFLINSAGAIARLDTGSASLEKVAENLEHFERALGDPATVPDWFLEPVVDELRSQGKRLGPGECYGFTVLPIFKGGSYTAGNRFCLAAKEHIRLTGDVHSQLRDVADGGRVRIEVTK